jgi:hypothetical protein
LFEVPCDTEFPLTKLSAQVSVDKNDGQFDGSTTDGGGGPVSTGFWLQAGSLGSQCVVPFCTDDAAKALEANAPKPARVNAPAATHAANANVVRFTVPDLPH